MEGLPSFIDVKKVAEIGLLVIMIIQYFKAAIPEKIIPVVSVFLGIGISFGYTANIPIGDWTPYQIFVTIINGAVGAFASDTAYSFLSSGKSPAFTLPDRASLIADKPPATTTGG
jgi:hypothetical protein